MTEPTERLAREAGRGRSNRTPWLALTGVTLVIAAVVAVLLVVLFLIYFLV
jgi:Flp pilus assembly protein TadB